MNKALMVMLLGIFMLGLVSSAPPASVSSNTNGLNIFAPEFQAVKYNTTFKLHIHVSDVATGVQLDNTEADCYLHLYNMAGSHLLEANISKDGNGYDHDLTILGGNFTEHGEFNGYYIWCVNNAGDLGGELKGFYEITANGKPQPEGIVVIAFSVVLLLILSGSVVFFVKAMGHIINKDFDLMDLATMWGLFFSLLGVQQLAILYMGSVEINSWLDLFVKTYAFPMVIVPVIALLLSIFNMNKQAKEKKRQW